MGSNLAWRTEGRLHVCVHSSRDPTNVDWQRYLNASRELVARGDLRIVILSRGGTPSGEQRRSLIAAVGKKTWPVALLTDNGVARMAIFAMRVFNPAMKAFPTDDLRGAGDFLGLTSQERERAAVLLAEIERDMGDSPTPHVGGGLA